jgi:spore germination protein YaaH
MSRLPTFARTVALLSTAALAVLPVRSGAQSIPRAERLFYYVDRESSWDSFSKHVDQIGIVAPQSFSVDSLGIVFGEVDPLVIKLAAQHGVKVMPLVVNESFNQTALHKLLTDSVARTRAIDAMVALCRRDGYWGIQFDVENVSIADRDRFTAWYQAASRALHAAGYRISIAIVPRAGDLAGATAYNRWIFDSWRGGYDLAALGKASDFVSWMTYDQHTRRTPPGPVAGLPWMRATVDFALQYIPADKLSLGVPLYGTQWYVQMDPASPLRAGTTGGSVTYAWGSHLIERAGGTIQWDDVQKTSYGSAMVGGVNTWIYFGDVRSFNAQLDLARERKLRGISAWVLGLEDPRIWDTLAGK